MKEEVRDPRGGRREYIPNSLYNNFTTYHATSNPGFVRPENLSLEMKKRLGIEETVDSLS